MFLTKAASDIYCENIEEQERIKMMVDLAQVKKIEFVLHSFHSKSSLLGKCLQIMHLLSEKVMLMFFVRFLLQ